MSKLSEKSDRRRDWDKYILVTSRYDSIINNFENGLYQYIVEHHFYDPEISLSTLKYNLNILL